jgi:SAM-dependent methyltransferase
MTINSAAVDHYGHIGLGDKILAALTAAGKDVDRLAPDDLAPIDEFHTRGRTATVELAHLLQLSADHHVLDLGCGIGGPSRYLAQTFGCRVTGLDLTPEFCRVAAMLTERTGLSNRIDYREGDALAIPFPDQSFDVVWSQNVAMNIADRGRFYAQILRVLKPGGRYGFADIVAGNGNTPHFPLPWARLPTASFLLTAQATRDALTAAGLVITTLEDQSDDAIAQQKARTQLGSTALGVHLILGADGPAILRNSVRSLEEGSIRLVQGVAVRPF